MNIPPEVQLKATLRSGSVYYFIETTFASREPHYFIVLNHHPATDDVLILVCSSSQKERVKRRRRGLPAATLLEISQAEYKDFSTDASIVDCNYVVQKTASQLLAKIEQGELKFKSVMDSALVDKLRNGVFASPVVAEEIKKRYLR